MKFIAALLVGGTFVSADMPNPAVGECAIADVVVTRSEPTMIDPAGEVTGMRLWLAYSYQDQAGNTLVRTVDDVCALDIDLDDAELIAAAADELIED